MPFLSFFFLSMRGDEEETAYVTNYKLKTLILFFPFFFFFSYSIKTDPVNTLFRE